MSSTTSPSSHVLVEALFREHKRDLIIFVEKKFGRYLNAEDVISEVFSRSLSSDSLLVVPPEKQKAWLVQTAKFVSFELLRSRVTIPVSEDVDQKIADNRPTLENAFIARESLEEIMKQIRTLPSDDKLLIELRVMEGYSFKKIASTVGITAETAKKRYYRAMTKLRTQIRRTTKGGVAGLLLLFLWRLKVRAAYQASLGKNLWLGVAVKALAVGIVTVGGVVSLTLSHQEPGLYPPGALSILSMSSSTDKTVSLVATQSSDNHDSISTPSPPNNKSTSSAITDSLLSSPSPSPVSNTVVTQPTPTPTPSSSSSPLPSLFPTPSPVGSECPDINNRYDASVLDVTLSNLPNLRVVQDDATGFKVVSIYGEQRFILFTSSPRSQPSGTSVRTVSVATRMGNYLAQEYIDGEQNIVGAELRLPASIFVWYQMESYRTYEIYEALSTVQVPGCR